MIESIIIATIMRPEGETGVQSHFRSLLNYFRSSGIKCSLITPYDSSFLLVYPIFGFRKILSLLSDTASVWWYRNWHKYFLQKALEKEFKKNNKCIIYAQCPISAKAALEARVDSSQHIIMVVHFNISQSDEWVEKKMIKNDGKLYHAIKNLECFVLPKLDGLVFVSKFMRLKLLDQIPSIKKVPYAIIPNFIADPSDANNTSKEYDLISIGSLEPRKNQIYLLQIIAAARDKGKNLRLTIVGNGPDRAELEKLAKTIKVDKLVYFAGYISTAIRLMDSHRAFIHVALMENLPVAIIEAMAKGLPVFAIPVGGIPEIFTDEIEGRYLPIDDAPAAALKIIEWLSNPHIMEMAKEAGRKKFLGYFESTRVGYQLTKFLKRGEDESYLNS